MKACVDEEACTGCGPCAEVCPEVFEIVDGVARLKVDRVPREAEDACLDAVESCGPGAITVEI